MISPTPSEWNHMTTSCEPFRKQMDNRAESSCCFSSSSCQCCISSLYCMAFCHHLFYSPWHFLSFIFLPTHPSVLDNLHRSSGSPSFREYFGSPFIGFPALSPHHYFCDLKYYISIARELSARNKVVCLTYASHDSDHSLLYGHLSICHLLSLTFKFLWLQLSELQSLPLHPY